MTDLVPVEAGPLRLAEGPAWDGERVWFVDVFAGSVFRFELGGPVETVLTRDEPVTFALPHRDGGVLVGHGRSVSHLCDDGSPRTLVDELPGTTPGVRVNDAAIDPDGRLVVGTMAYDAKTPAGALYRVGLDGDVEVLRDGIVCSNGIGWYGDRMYHVDTAERRVDVYTGDGDRELFVAVDNGSPDGLAVDAEGHVWVAVWNGARVDRYAPDGTRSGVVEVPHPKATSVCFAGPDLDTLVITTAEEVFLAEPGVSGVPCPAAQIR